MDHHAVRNGADSEDQVAALALRLRIEGADGGMDGEDHQPPRREELGDGSGGQVWVCVGV